MIASHNPGKVREIGDLLQPHGIEVIAAKSLGLAEPIESGETFADNARIKAVEAAKASGLAALADDSGLQVHGLGGDPGVLSARWAGPDKDFGLAMKRVQDALGETADRSASFVCALALARPVPGGDGGDGDGDGDGLEVEIFEGRVDGHITWPPRGDAGFGYDPIFVAKGHDRSFGEMPPEAKAAISHRARAFAKLVAACFAGPGEQA